MKVKVLDRPEIVIRRHYFLDGVEINSEMVDFLRDIKEEPGEFRCTEAFTKSIEDLKLFTQPYAHAIGATLTKRGKNFLKLVEQEEWKKS